LNLNPEHLIEWKDIEVEEIVTRKGGFEL